MLNLLNDLTGSTENFFTFETDCKLILHKKWSYFAVYSMPFTWGFVAVNFAVVVFDELLDEVDVLVEEVVSHVRDVVQHRLVFNLWTRDSTEWAVKRSFILPP